MPPKQKVMEGFESPSDKDILRLSSEEFDSLQLFIRGLMNFGPNIPLEVRYDALRAMLLLRLNPENPQQYKMAVRYLNELNRTHISYLELYLIRYYGNDRFNNNPLIES